jgi:regulator of nucleoside diphosphate kinase
VIARTTSSERNVVITEPDFDRLKVLMDSPRYRSIHAMRLVSLQEELDHGKVVPADKVPKNVVTMHSQVRVWDIGTEESDTYTLVYPVDAYIEEGKVSVLAPLGLALLGARVGQVVKFDAPAGLRRLRIQKILYQPEAAGDFHL